MARGFESKAVADQQETAQERKRPAKAGATDPERAARKRQLELARVDIERRLAVAVAPAHRQMLERALRALDAELAAFD
jgi:hypothetical protein